MLFVVCAAVACSIERHEPPGLPLDAGPNVPNDAAVEPGPCNPLTQLGCMPAEKCGWIVDQVMPQILGHTGCAPNGTKDLGAACMYGPPGQRGYDDCLRGQACAEGTCEVICDPNGGPPQCDASHACVVHPDLFFGAAGVCDPK